MLYVVVGCSCSYNISTTNNKTKMGKSSQLSIDPDVKKWKVVSLWYVVFLIKFTLSNAEGRWSSFPPVLFKRRGVKRSIVPYCGPGSNNNIPGERLKSLRGGAAVNPFPSGYVTIFHAHTSISFAKYLSSQLIHTLKIQSVWLRFN